MQDNVVVVYHSKTGFTKKYAELIGEQLDCALMPLKEATGTQLSRFDTVIFGGRMFAGTIDGLKKIKGKVDSQRLVVFATGAAPNAAEDTIEGYWQGNFTAEELKRIPHFYMQSGLCFEKMGFVEKSMMKMLSKMLKKKKDKDEKEAAFEAAIASSFDISDPVYAEPLVEYIRNR